MECKSREEGALCRSSRKISGFFTSESGEVEAGLNESSTEYEINATENLMNSTSEIHTS